MTVWTVLHTGYPIAGRPIRDDEWKVYSKHKTFSAACKRIIKAMSHLSYGQWDDHYVITDGKDKYDFWFDIVTNSWKGSKRIARMENP